MGYLGEEIGKLGFGLMRLPKVGDTDQIDIEQTKEMVDAFLEAGFTYFDTAWAYDGSEDAIRQALVERYPRESFKLATKNAAWIKCKTRKDAIAQLETSLEQTGAGYFDFYLLHNLGGKRTSVFDEFDLWSWAFEEKEKGRIKHVGFSFHGDAAELEEILTKHPEAEFVQLQINYGDWENTTIQAKACYEIARKHGKPNVIMEPVKGGNLATPPQTVVDVFKAADPDASPASWALRFAADLDGVITVLSGMSNMDQMRDNLASMKGFTKLTAGQREVIQKAQEELAKVPIIPCTACHYCAKVCPMDIGIAPSFYALNMYTMYGNLQSAQNSIGFDVVAMGKKKAEECIKCGACEDACPQHIAIRDELEHVTEVLG